MAVSSKEVIYRDFVYSRYTVISSLIKIQSHSSQTRCGINSDEIECTQGGLAIDSVNSKGRRIPVLCLKIRSTADVYVP